MKYVEQSHKDLRLYLLDECPDKDIFTLISEAKFSDAGFKINFGILAESHFVTVQSENDCVSEICACSTFDIKNLDTKLLTEIGDANLITDTDTLRHTFNYKFHNMAVGEVKLKALRSKRAHPHSHYLEHDFPTAKPGDISPVTEVYITLMGKEVLIESVHTYPNHNAMAFTMSTISIKGA